ncbi:MAG: HAMP domain-containing histidine kinase [Burkholderiales bacterium]|nr:HAMP domain-containing histidine kinase [Burkholderiales bacterium]MBH2016536.1 HAMP domain-containing histidine kinase [Burkholderiales bacterium]
MSRYVVPPPERTEGSATLNDTRLNLTRWLAAMSSIACILVWWNDERHGMNSAWASVAVPSVAACLALAAALVWLRPRQHNLGAGIATVGAAVYFIGSLVSTSGGQGPHSLYEVASNAQFMPMLYLGAFVTMTRGAARLSWITYAGIVAAYVSLYGARAPQGADPVAHFWFTLLITHPLFILALSYVSVLQSKLSRAELEANAGRERFLAMLSHEIRTPLQGMLGSIDLLDIKVQGATERRAIGRLRQISSQLTAHLRDLTEYTRMDNPAWRLQPEGVDLVALIDDISQEHRPRVRAKGLQLHVDVDDAPALHRIETDPNRVRQVLDNLIHNALKYTAQGSISLSLRTAPDRADRLELTVADTGIGIHADAMPHIFEPYVRLEDRKLPRTEGSGLGLAVVRRLVDRLGGDMAVESTPERGSTFRVWLPLPTPA